jgi:signal transduction histidine kinase
MRPPLLVIIAVGLLVTILLALGWLDALELPARDAALRVLPVSGAAATAVIAIDERSLREVGAWPWPRERVAQLVERCAASGARAAILDVLLVEARPGDERLAAAMQRFPAIAVSVLIEGEQWLVPAPLLQPAATIAHGNFELDRDGIVRRFAASKQNGARAYTALSLEAASVLRPMAVPVGAAIAPAFRTPPRRVPLVSAADVLHGRANHLLRDRLVFIGPTALGLGDRVLTPVSSTLAPDPGVTVHAAATESLLRGELVRPLAPIAGGLAAALLTATMVALRARARALRIAVDLLLAIVVIAGGAILLAMAGIAIPFVTLVLTAGATAGTIEALAMSASLRESRGATIRLEEIATRVAEQRAHEIESKRILAHELKTPLASMRNLTQLLGGYELTDAERRRVAYLLEAEAGKLQSMITALLDLERLPLRDFEASSSVTDLGELVRARVELLRASAGRPLIADVPRGIRVRADAMLIERVVDNLVSNAVKYSPPPEPIHVAVRESGGEAVLEVTDRGPGIAPRERERVFQRFVRGASAAGTEGLGLGLSLVAEVARWHGGRVDVDDAPGGGAVFRFAIPAAVPQAAAVH